MTTIELIERGIGHNCLSDAYDLGRADFKKSEEYCQAINEAFNNGIDVGKRELMKDALIIKARIDAIDEYNKELKAYLRRFSLGSVSDKDFDYIAEQLKEQK